MSLATQGSVLKQNIGLPKPTPPNSGIGMLSSSSGPMQGPPAPNMSIAPKQTGMSVPLTAGVNSSSQQKVTKVDTAGNTTTTHAAQSNPGVLKQQQDLNAANVNTPGYVPLITDGIAGPKTSAALAQYGYNTQTGQPNTPKPTPAPTPTTPPAPTTPQVGTTTENAQHVLDTGNITPLEQQSRDAVTQAGKMTPEEQAAANQVQAETNKLKGYQNASSVSPYAELGLYGDRVRTPEELLALQQAPDLAGRASATYGLTNNLENIYGTGAVYGAGQQLGAAQTAAGRGQTAANTNLGAAQTQASRAQGAAGTVFSSSLLSPQTQGLAPFSSLNGYEGGTAGQFGDPNDPASAANAQAYKSYYDKYNAGLGGINTAVASEPGIINTLTQFGLNTQPISAITNLKELLSGQTSAPGQQQLATQVANYIKQLGIDPATLSSSIANQQSGTLVQLLNNLKDIATKNNNALKTTADSLKKPTANSSSSSTSSGGTTGDFSWDFLKGL